MGVRVEREGELLMDYHTAGAGYGLMSAQGKVKKTATTGEFETLVTRREYLCDAAFLVGLSGPLERLLEYAAALEKPHYPPFLGRKSCPPSRPVYEALMTDSADLQQVLSLYKLSDTALPALCPSGLRLVLPATPDTAGAQHRNDLPLCFLPRRFASRYVVECRIPLPGATIDCGDHTTAPRFGVRYNSAQWRRIADERLRRDGYLCVFTGLPADCVHHITYAHAGDERVGELRSLSNLCHDAVTMLEAERGMTETRLDPFPDDPALRATPEYARLAADVRGKMDEILRDRLTSDVARAKRARALEGSG
jgi:CRISPR-associated protein Cas5/CasD subtype I-E